MWSYFYPMANKAQALPYADLHGVKLDTPYFKPLGRSLGYYHAPSRTLLIQQGNQFIKSNLLQGLDLWDYYTDDNSIIYLCRDGIYRSELDLSGLHKISVAFNQRISASNTTMADKTNHVIEASSVVSSSTTPGGITKTSAGYVVLVPFKSLIDGSYVTGCFLGNTIEQLYHRHDYQAWDTLVAPSAHLIQDGDFLYGASVMVKNHKRTIVISFDGGKSYGDAVIAGNEYYGSSMSNPTFISNTPLVSRFIKPAIVNHNLERNEASTNQPYYLSTRIANSNFTSPELERSGSIQSLVSVALDFNMLGNGDDIVPPLGSYIDGCMGEDGLLYLTGAKNVVPGRYGDFVTWGQDVLTMIPGNGSVITLDVLGTGTTLEPYLAQVPVGDVFVSAKHGSYVLINHKLNGVWRNFVFSFI